MRVERRNQTAFENLKREIFGIPSWAPPLCELQIVITVDASRELLGATLWQDQPDGKIKSNAFASRIISNAERRYAINDFELLAAVYGLTF